MTDQILTNPAADSYRAGKKHLAVSLLLLGGLLFLRLPFLTVAAILLPDKASSATTAVTILFDGGTYLLTAILIWWERERLREFWVDLAGAITFLCQTFCFPLGIGLFWRMRRSHARFPAPAKGVWRWALAGAILAIACDLLVMALGINPAHPRGPSSASFPDLVVGIFFMMTNAAVWEEPLFRGFLWGYLRLAKWKNSWIWLFQAALFTLGHVYYLKSEAFIPWLIRMLLPSLLFGFIAWRARSIFASMVTHGTFNATGDMLFHSRSLSGAMQVAWSGMIILIVILGCVLIFEWGIQKRTLR